MAISYGRTDIETPIHADIKETISHGIIVSNLAYLVGKELGLQEEVCYDLAVAGMLHDLGKVRLNFYMNEKVEDEILAVDDGEPADHVAVGGSRRSAAGRGAHAQRRRRRGSGGARSGRHGRRDGVSVEGW